MMINPTGCTVQDLTCMSSHKCISPNLISSPPDMHLVLPPPDMHLVSPPPDMHFTNLNLITGPLIRPYLTPLEIRSDWRPGNKAALPQTYPPHIPSSPNSHPLPRQTHTHTPTSPYSTPPTLLSLLHISHLLLSPPPPLPTHTLPTPHLPHLPPHMKPSACCHHGDAITVVDGESSLHSA